MKLGDIIKVEVQILVLTSQKMLPKVCRRENLQVYIILGVNSA